MTSAEKHFSPVADQTVLFQVFTHIGWLVSQSLFLLLQGEPPVFSKLAGIRFLKKKMIFYKARESNSLLVKSEIKFLARKANSNSLGKYKEKRQKYSSCSGTWIMFDYHGKGSIASSNTVNIRFKSIMLHYKRKMQTL
ncbi:MAG TPA: hypothetical protein VNB68_00605, partial [Nitrososphaeraceae archaeon]|nr:hypothetical protein [Nitrososphaeraceae archaeon]